MILALHAHAAVLGCSSRCDCSVLSQVQTRSSSEGACALVHPTTFFRREGLAKCDAEAHECAAWYILTPDPRVRDPAAARRHNPPAAAMGPDLCTHQAALGHAAGQVAARQQRRSAQPGHLGAAADSGAAAVLCNQPRYARQSLPQVRHLAVQPGGSAGAAEGGGGGSRCCARWRHVSVSCRRSHPSTRSTSPCGGSSSRWQQ